MKFRVMMKDPDTLYDAIDEAVTREVAKLDQLDDDEKEVVKENRAEKIRELAGRWFEYGEYLNVEIDTEAGTCVVVPMKP
jgi:hypothetical protein